MPLRTDAPNRRPTVLVSSDGEWFARALESILEPQGYALARATSAKQMFEWVLRARPDLILVDAHLRDLDSAEACRTLFLDLKLPRSVPVVVVSSTESTRDERLAALRAGAIDVVRFPMDAEELVCKLEAYLRVAFEANRAWDVSLVDSATGLYNRRGLSQRAREMGADAARRPAPLACVAFGAAPKPGGGNGVVEHIAQVLRASGRTSDAIGKVGDAEFAVLAPATSAENAARLARRLLAAIDAALQTGAPAHAFGVQVGYDAVAEDDSASFPPDELLARASRALAQGAADPAKARIRRYDAHLR